MMISDEQQELDGLRRLDAQTISAAYDRYFPIVYRYVRYRVNDDQQAEDITADVFVRLLEAAQAHRAPDTNLKAWLLATASHAANDHLRRLYRRPTTELSEVLPDGLPTPAHESEQREQNQHVRDAYRKLTPEQQHVLALRFSQGLSLEETAGIMKKNINAIKALQFRAMAALNREIGEVL